MNTPTSDLRIPNLKRSAFTLVELLIVITIIGILVGLLLPAVRGALNAANELAVRTEMTQIEQAIESFNTQYGFYPPSFEQYNRSEAGNLSHPGLAAFLRHLNRIAPNHQETRTFFPGITAPNTPRAVVWWNKVGRHLDQTSSMMFWLTGLTKSQQFPLTGGAFRPIPAFGVDTYSNGARFEILKADGTTDTILPDGSPFVIERVDFLKNLSPGQFLFNTVDASDLLDDSETLNSLVSRNVDVVPGSELAVTAGYRQVRGPSNSENLFVYRDAPSYIPNPLNLRRSGYAYITNLPNPLGDPIGGATFANPRTYQLISPGLDGELGVPFGGESMPTEFQLQLQASAFPTAPLVLNEVQALDSDWGASDARLAADNMANFAAGRLELIWIEEGVE